MNFIKKNKNVFSSLKELKNSKKKIVLCHGVFDVFHLGHLNYFYQAKNYGEILVVSVTSDKYVNKGDARPIFKTQERVKVLQELKIIDFVIVSNHPTAKNIIQKIKPHYYCKGPDYSSLRPDKKLKEEISMVENFGGKFVTVKHRKRSSTSILKKKDMLSNDYSINENYLSHLRSKYTTNYIIEKVEDFKKVNVLVTGDLILDRYIFTDPIGKSGKDSFSVLKKKSEIKFVGGSAHIAKVASKLVNKVSLLSFIGDKNSNESFIIKNLNRNIKFKFFKKKNSSTFLKTRFLDNYTNNKILGVYDINDDQIDERSEKIFLKELNKNNFNNDLFIVADYGHGIITNLVKRGLQKKSNNLFVNCQINSFNRGLNSIASYGKANTLIMNENEIRNELKDKNSSLIILHNKLKKKIMFKTLFITRGKYGSILFKNNKVYEAPSFANQRIDTVGAGDAFLCVASIAEKANCPPDLSLFLASVYAAHSVMNIGKKKILDYKNFRELIIKILNNNSILN